MHYFNTILWRLFFLIGKFIDYLIRRKTWRWSRGGRKSETLLPGVAAARPRPSPHRPLAQPGDCLIVRAGPGAWGGGASPSFVASRCHALCVSVPSVRQSEYSSSLCLLLFSLLVTCSLYCFCRCFFYLIMYIPLLVCIYQGLLYLIVCFYHGKLHSKWADPPQSLAQVTSGK